MNSYKYGFVQVQVFFETYPDMPLGLPDVRVGRDVITRDVMVYGSTYVIQESLVLRVYTFGAQCVGISFRRYLGPVIDNQCVIKIGRSIWVKS